MTQLSSSLELTVHELAACRDCCSEAQNQLSKLTNSPTEKLNNATCMYAVNMLNVDCFFACVLCIIEND